MTKKVTFGKKHSSDSLPDMTRADEWVKSRQDSEVERIKRLTIDIPADLHSRIKSQCALKGIKMNEAIRELLEKHFPVQG